MKNKQLQLALGIIAVIFLAAIARLSDSIPNFAPIGALALFSGAVIRDRRWSFILPIGAIFLSDVFLETLQKGGGFYPGMVYNYAAYLLIVLLGFILRNRISLPAVMGTSIAASVTFFIVSNIGVWISGSLGYAYTWNGFVQCFEMARPFFRYTLTSDLVFSCVFFGAYYLATNRRSVSA